MLMDLFYDCCPIRNKLRIHFHEFMADVHRRIHIAKQDHLNQVTSTRKGRISLFTQSGIDEAFDPIPPVADAIIEQYRVICFDEFQVTYIKSIHCVAWEGSWRGTSDVGGWRSSQTFMELLSSFIADRSTVLLMNVKIYKLTKTLIFVWPNCNDLFLAWLWNLANFDNVIFYRWYVMEF